jgi:hypothetical protein
MQSAMAVAVVELCLVSMVSFMQMQCSAMWSPAHMFWWVLSWLCLLQPQELQLVHGVAYVAGCEDLTAGCCACSTEPV